MGIHDMDMAVIQMNKSIALVFDACEIELGFTRGKESSASKIMDFKRRYSAILKSEPLTFLNTLVREHVNAKWYLEHQTRYAHRDTTAAEAKDTDTEDSDSDDCALSTSAQESGRMNGSTSVDTNNLIASLGESREQLASMLQNMSISNPSNDVAASAAPPPPPDPATLATTYGPYRTTVEDEEEQDSDDDDEAQDSD